MKRLLLLAVLLCGGCSASSVAAPSRPEGDEPYTPTKLEWLIVEASAHKPAVPDIRFTYHAKPGTNCIEIGIIAPRHLDAELVRGASALALVGLDNQIAKHKWTWVQVKTNTVLTD
jgi:hypothetical protein